MRVDGFAQMLDAVVDSLPPAVGYTPTTTGVQSGGGPVGRPPQVIKLFAIASELKLSRQERIEIAEVTLRRDITSWSDLTADEAGRMIDTLSGYINVMLLLSQRN